MSGWAQVVRYFGRNYAHCLDGLALSVQGIFEEKEICRMKWRFTGLRLVSHVRRTSNMKASIWKSLPKSYVTVLAAKRESLNTYIQVQP
jgi:hypothetical protein